MKNGIKKIFGYICTFFAGVLSFIVYYLLHNRRADGTIEDGVSRAEQSIKSAERKLDGCTEQIEDSRRIIGEVGDGIDGIQEGVSRVQESVGRCEEIFEQIKNQKLD